MRTSYPPLTSRSTLPFDRQAARNASSSCRRVAAPRASLRDSVSPPAVDTTDRLDAVAHRDLELAVGVLQLGDLDRRFALAADVDEGHLGPDRDDGALDGLPCLEALRLERRLEHRGEIVFFGRGASPLELPYTGARGDP